MQHSYDDNERGDGRWYWRSPISEFSDERVQQYRQHFDIPVSDVTTEIGRSADCWCGCFGDRTELIDLEAAGYADHAEWLRSLQTPMDVPREHDHWAGGNYDRGDFATVDDRQQTLCSSCGLDKTREAADD